MAPGSDRYGKGGRAWLATAPRSSVRRAQTERLLTLHDARTVEMLGLDGDGKQAAKGHPVVTQLTTMPGVGMFGALFLQAEIGSIDRFTSRHALVASAGLVPTMRSSGGKTAPGGLGTASNRWLKWILVEIVVTLTLAPVGTYSRHLLRAKGKPKAQAAAARTLCWYLYWMLKEGWTDQEWLQQHVDSQRSEVRPVQRMGAMA